MYNAIVDVMRFSFNIVGEYDGGGVCIDCKVRGDRLCNYCYMEYSEVVW